MPQDFSSLLLNIIFYLLSVILALLLTIYIFIGKDEKTNKEQIHVKVEQSHAKVLAKLHRGREEEE